MRYKIFNAPMPTIAVMTPIATGTAIKTLLQLKPFLVGRIIEWGIAFDGYTADVPVQVELLDTGTVFATVTASVDAGIFKVDGNDDVAASVGGLTLGTSATGYTASDEGTITTTRVYESVMLAPSTQFCKIDLPLGREHKLIVGNATRIRVKAAATVNALCWMTLEF